MAHERIIALIIIAPGAYTFSGDRNLLPLAGETACPTCFPKRSIQQVGQAVSPAVPIATINGQATSKQGW